MIATLLGASAAPVSGPLRRAEPAPTEPRTLSFDHVPQAGELPPALAAVGYGNLVRWASQLPGARMSLLTLHAADAQGIEVDVSYRADDQGARRPPQEGTLSDNRGTLEHEVLMRPGGARPEETIKLIATSQAELERLSPALQSACGQSGIDLPGPTDGWLIAGPALTRIVVEGHSGASRTSLCTRANCGPDCVRTLNSSQVPGGPLETRETVEVRSGDLAGLTDAAELLQQRGAVDAVGYLRQVFDHARVHPSELHVETCREQDGSTTTVDFQLRDDRGMRVGAMNRVFHHPVGGPASVSHASFTLNQPNQGKHLARQILGESISFYESQGFHEVDVHAGLDVGGYAWAKYGFLPVDARETQTLLQALRPKLARLSLEPAVRSKVETLLTSQDPQSLWAIADLETPVEVDGRNLSLGKALLLGEWWQGRLDLEDAAVRERFRAYVSEGIQGGPKSAGI